MNLTLDPGKAEAADVVVILDTDVEMFVVDATTKAFWKVDGSGSTLVSWGLF